MSKALSVRVAKYHGPEGQKSASVNLFEPLGLRPHVVGAFDGNALLAICAARGLGGFAVSPFGDGGRDCCKGLQRLGQPKVAQEEIYVVRLRRG